MLNCRFLNNSDSPSSYLRTNALDLSSEGMLLALVETGEGWLWPERYWSVFESIS
ncbi:hypothetical protein DhcVS_1346 [Dehalococcoides mccartyi VS]|uniref:Uncharacterized protein n=1 Tax=Dehalococcoides mccartyi (strain VS) TaxID=311424 RepID=D2BJE5_DEHMV|nr:hypothetical protein DhcVS_1346 [Dehalococcoides mccartyi VS]